MTCGPTTGDTQSDNYASEEPQTEKVPGRAELVGGVSPSKSNLRSVFDPTRVPVSAFTGTRTETLTRSYCSQRNVLSFKRHRKNWSN